MVFLGDIKSSIFIILLIHLTIGSINASADQWENSDDGKTAKTWSTTSLSILSGSDYKLGDKDRTIATFDHSSGGKWVNNHFFFDIINPNSNFITMYGEWHPGLNITRLFKQAASFEMLKSISIVGEYNYGTNPMASFRSHYVGIGFELNIKNAHYSIINFMYGGDPTISEDTEQITIAWSFPFQLSFLHGEFNGYVDYIGAESYRVSHLQSQPQLLFDIGRIIGFKNSLYLGLEYQYWRNKFGKKGIDEKLPQLITTFKF